MCMRFYLKKAEVPPELWALIDAMNRGRFQRGEVKTAGEIRPTDVTMALACSQKMEIKPFAMKWGYDEGNRLLFNARSESADRLPVFMDGFLHRRCLIPVTNYFEWEHRGSEKIKYAISQQNRELTYLAGIYRIVWGRPEYTILTREPAEKIAFIHDRMPLMMDKEMVKDWLNPRYQGKELLKYAVEDLAFVKIE